ncbi:hypothetical protein K2P47_01500 [Patescibacteria group bacterium]|nr:hypothetical protein [Patescibacteria group bacterium]
MKFTSLATAPLLGTPVVVCNSNHTLSVISINSLRFEDEEKLDGPVIAGLTVFQGGDNKNVWLASNENIRIAVAYALQKIALRMADDTITRREDVQLNDLIREYFNIDAVIACLMAKAAKFEPLPEYHPLGTLLYSVNQHENRVVEHGPVRKIKNIGDGSFSYETGCQQYNASYFTTLNEALDAIAKSLPSHLQLVREEVQVKEAVSEQEGRRLGWFSGD